MIKLVLVIFDFFISKAISDFISNFGPSVDDQAVSLSDDGTTIIIDFFSSSFSLFSFSAITVLPERVVAGFPNFAWAPKKK
jgi:hypothetical protein